MILEIAIANYQTEIDSLSNLTRLIRRFVAADEVFAKRFAISFNKYSNVEIANYSNSQKVEKAAESKAVNIDYQHLYSAKTDIATKITEEITIANEVDTNYYFYYYHDFEKIDLSTTKV